MATVTRTSHIEDIKPLLLHAMEKFHSEEAIRLLDMAKVMDKPWGTAVMMQIKNSRTSEWVAFTPGGALTHSLDYWYKLIRDALQWDFTVRVAVGDKTTKESIKGLKDAAPAKEYVDSRWVDTRINAK